MQPIHLAIPTPCHENWDNMLPVEKGRFCNACAKQVVDFSNMSDAQVLNYFTNLKNESVCGRVYPEQLSREITGPKELKKTWYFKYAAMFLMLFSRSGDAKAQTQNAIAQQQPIETLMGDTIMIQGEIAPAYKQSISGRVVDANGNPIELAQFIVGKNKQQFTADNNGYFTINTYDKQTQMTVIASGYEDKIVTINAAKKFTIVLKAKKAAPMIMGKMIAHPIPQKIN